MTTTAPATEAPAGAPASGAPASGATPAPRAAKTALKKLTPNLMVEDVTRTIDFYRDVLGFEVLATVPDSQDGSRDDAHAVSQPTADLDWAMLSRDGVTLMFQRRGSLAGEIPALAGVPIGGAVTFYTEVEGVEMLREQLRGRVEMVLELHDTFYGTREFCFRDCNGYLISFSEELAERRAPAQPED